MRISGSHVNVLIAETGRVVIPLARRACEGKVAKGKTCCTGSKPLFVSFFDVQHKLFRCVVDTGRGRAHKFGSATYAFWVASIDGLLLLPQNANAAGPRFPHLHW